MTEFETQKTMKLKMPEVAEMLLSSEKIEMYNRIAAFLRENKISAQWGSTNSFNLNFKGYRAGRITFGTNQMHIVIGSAQRDKFDGYLEGQTDEVKAMFFDTIKRKCTGCTRCAPGKSFAAGGKQYEHICFGGMGAHGFVYRNISDEHLQAVFALLAARTDYIIRALSQGIKPGTAY